MSKSNSRPTEQCVCQHCGASFLAASCEVRRGWGKYCSLSCTNKARKAAAGGWLKEWGPNPKPKKTASPAPLRPATCAQCGQTFMKRGPRKYCSEDCARASRYQPVRDVGVFVTKTCKRCGKAFTINFHIERAFCSAVCGNRASSSRRKHAARGGFVEHIDLLNIAERDHWRCQLCGKAVKRTAIVPEWMAPTLDHIVPISCGGTHEMANVQLAHFICNTRKGARAMNEQLRLLG
jgi:hypothetical protein